VSVRRIVYWLSLVLIFTIPWEGAVRLSGGDTTAKLMGYAVAVFWLLMVVTTGRLRRPTAFLVATLMFVVWNGLSVFWSADPMQSLRHVLTWVQLLGLAFILWDLYRTRAGVLAGLQAYVLGAYVAIGGAVANYFGSNPFYTHYERFGPGEATNPDGFGFIVALGVPVASYLASSADATKPALFKVLNYAYIPAAFLGIALSGTRTAAIAAVVGMVFGLASLTRLRLSARVTVLIVLATALYFLVPVVQPLRSFERLGTTRTELTQGDLNGRLDQWREGLAAFAQHPILGVGSNMYRSVNALGKVAHNSFISVLVQLGLVGFVLFGIILAIVLVQARGQPKWERSFWLTLLVVWTIGSSTLTWEHRKSTWLFLTLAVASAALTTRRTTGPAVRASHLHEVPSETG